MTSATWRRIFGSDTSKGKEVGNIYHILTRKAGTTIVLKWVIRYNKQIFFVPWHVQEASGKSESDGNR